MLITDEQEPQRQQQQQQQTQKKVDDRSKAAIHEMQWRREIRSVILMGPIESCPLVNIDRSPLRDFNLWLCFLAFRFGEWEGGVPISSFGARLLYTRLYCL